MITRLANVLTLYTNPETYLLYFVLRMFSAVAAERDIKAPSIRFIFQVTPDNIFLSLDL